MKVLISGASGLIGSALLLQLTRAGHRVIRLVRSPRGDDPGAIRWDPGAGQLDQAALEGVEAVVHLAGENVAGRWTPEKMERIRRSRVDATQLLCGTLARLETPPRVIVCASAIGYYGDRGDEVLCEDSVPGSGFLAGVCRDWEMATQPATEAGIRVVRLRFGIVLSAAGGALKPMLLPFRLGLGGRIGSGRQFWSWLALEDAIGIIDFALHTETLRGAVNAVAPRAATNNEFTRILGKVLGRPTLLPVSAGALRLALGRMADEGILASARVEPAMLQAAGYGFQFPELPGALRHLLG